MGKAGNLLPGGKPLAAAVRRGVCSESSGKVLARALPCVLLLVMGMSLLPAAFQTASLGGDHKTGGMRRGVCEEAAGRGA